MGMIGRLVKWTLMFGIAVLVLTIGAVMYLSDANLRRYGNEQALATPVDAVLVLGGGIDGDGVLGFSSRRRVQVAVALLKSGQTRYLIFTGGSDWKNPDDTAAGLMRAHAIAIGTPPQMLLIETRALSTFENLQFGFALAEQQGLGQLAILTDAFHLERARWLAAYFGQPDAGLIAVRGLESDGIANRVWSILREALAWWLNLAKVAGWEVLAKAGMDVDARQKLIR